MRYRVVMLIETEEEVHPEDIAEHCAVACAAWGGQYEPSHPMFNVNASATCRGHTVDKGN